MLLIFRPSELTKAEQLGLFDMPVQVAAHARKDGAVVNAHTRIQKKRLDQQQGDMFGHEPAAKTEKSAGKLEPFLRKYGGAGRLLSILRGLTEEQRGKVLAEMGNLAKRSPEQVYRDLQDRAGAEGKQAGQGDLFEVPETDFGKKPEKTHWLDALKESPRAHVQDRLDEIKGNLKTKTDATRTAGQAFLDTIRQGSTPEEAAKVARMAIQGKTDTEADHYIRVMQGALQLAAKRKDVHPSLEKVRDATSEPAKAQDKPIDPKQLAALNVLVHKFGGKIKVADMLRHEPERAEKVLGELATAMGVSLDAVKEAVGFSTKPEKTPFNKEPEGGWTEADKIPGSEERLRAAQYMRQAAQLEDEANRLEAAGKIEPKEGDTKIENGIEYRLQGGRWHRVTPEENEINISVETRVKVTDETKAMVADASNKILSLLGVGGVSVKFRIVSGS
jgi:hypothetical protein